MKHSVLWKLFGLIILCMACGVAMKSNARAEETEREKPTLQEYMEGENLYYGEAEHCKYSYTEDGREIKIIGFDESVKIIKIPSMIEGKKVTEIAPVSTNVYKYDRKQSKTIKIVIPKYVKKIGVCLAKRNLSLPQLEQYQVSSENKYFKSKNGVIFSKGGRTLLYVPPHKKSKVYRIPAGVTKIKEYAFSTCDRIERVVMPDSVKKIEKSAFFFASVSKINLPKKLKTIENAAFDGTKIREITIPGTVRVIPAWCFGDCPRLKKVIIKSGVKMIDQDAFCWSKKLRKVYIPSSVKADGFGFSSFVYISSHVKTKNVNVTIIASKKSSVYKMAMKYGWSEYGVKVKAA